jgi:hypothetical protein
MVRALSRLWPAPLILYIQPATLAIEAQRPETRASWGVGHPYWGACYGD